MTHTQVLIHCARHKARTVEYALTKLAAAAITLTDAADEPILEPALGEQPLWQNTKISALFSEQIEREEIESELHKRCPHAINSISWEMLEDQAWERAWLNDYQPIDCGNGLWIVPSDHDDDILPAGSTSTTVILDPGLAFGTGTHPTTRLCLNWLAGASLRGKQILDYGCGSGILAIAALKRGATKALAVDIDPQAIIASKDNAKRNNISEGMLDLLVVSAGPIEAEGDSLQKQAAADQQYDIVFANILAGPLVELYPKLYRATRDGGTLCLSGITDDQVETIKAVYAKGFIVQTHTSHDNWSCLTLKRTALTPSTAVG